MESSQRDLSNDMAEHTPILKNNPNTWHPRFGFTPKTGIAFPKRGLSFYCVYNYLYRLTNKVRGLKQTFHKRAKRKKILFSEEKRSQMIETGIFMVQLSRLVFRPLRCAGQRGQWSAGFPPSHFDMKLLPYSSGPALASNYSPFVQNFMPHYKHVKMLAQSSHKTFYLEE